MRFFNIANAAIFGAVYTAVNVLAQSDSLTTCIYNCVQEAAADSGCTSVECVCASSQFISTASQCASANCGTGSEDLYEQAFEDYCDSPSSFDSESLTVTSSASRATSTSPSRTSSSSDSDSTDSADSDDSDDDSSGSTLPNAGEKVKAGLSALSGMLVGLGVALF